MDLGIKRMRLILLSGVALLVALSSCADPDRRVSGYADITELRERLAAESARQGKELGEANCKGRPVTREIAIIGDGLAGAAAARNIGEGIRIYGGRSFWDDLHGLPEIWQTDLSLFRNAGLSDPGKFDNEAAGGRLSKDAVAGVVQEAMIDAKAAYLQTGPVSVLPTTDGAWRIVDTVGHSEVITDAVIVATGLLRPNRLTDIIPGTLRARRTLSEDRKILSGDEFLSIRKPLGSYKVIGVLGASGNAADCIIHALRDAAVEKVVVWGDVPPELARTRAYGDMIRAYGDRICRVPGKVTMVSYARGGAIEVNGSSSVNCVRVSDGEAEIIQDVDLLLESLGRYEGDPPQVVASAARGEAIRYHPMIVNSELIGIRVSFGDGSRKHPPLYLIGAAASWVPAGVEITGADFNAFVDARDRTVAAVTPSVGPENGAPSFAVAAYMGWRLASECFGGGHLSSKAACQ
jgi:hypothetical protein